MKRTSLALLVPLLIWQAAAGQSIHSPLPEKQIRKAEKLLTELEDFEVFAVSHPGSQKYKTRVQQLADAIYEPASKLPETNVATDIATAVHFYELAALKWDDQGTSEVRGADCAREKPGAYRQLCETNPGSRSQLLLAKAHLHLSWARASIRAAQPGEDKLLNQIELERKNDLMLAERALTALRILQNEVIVHRSLSDFEENGDLARVPYDTFKDELRRISVEVEQILAWLPQDRLKFEISNALHSYQDGGMWWARIYQPLVVHVSAFVVPEGSRTPADQAFLSTIPYTIAINWRQAARYVGRAERIVDRSRGSLESSVKSFKP